jgi:PIN domain nuclease of toxin-antitoxin system
MRQVTIHEAKHQLSKLVQAALQGKEVIKASGIVPVQDNGFCFNIAGLWEWTMKVTLGKIRLAENWISALLKAIKLNQILCLAITPVHCPKIAIAKSC